MIWQNAIPHAKNIKKNVVTNDFLTPKYLLRIFMLRTNCLNIVWRKMVVYFIEAVEYGKFIKICKLQQKDAIRKIWVGFF